MKGIVKEILGWAKGTLDALFIVIVGFGLTLALTILVAMIAELTGST